MELLDFINTHENWEELLSEKPYCLKISRDNGYIMFKYSQIDSNFNLPEVRNARGIIFREADFKPVCVPFYKFGNAGESYCPEINWSTASVQEKIDGSLTKVWFDDGWHISTNGTIDAFKASLQSIKYKTFGDLFLAALPYEFDEFTALLDKDYTYMFELISPENRVVIPYQETKLYALGARNNITLQEVMPEETILNHRFSIPKRYNLHSYNNVKKAAEALDWQEEGYVVCDDEFNRVKIKSPSYVKAHFARSNGVITFERLMDIVLCGEQAEFLIYASDYKDELEKIETIYISMLQQIREVSAKLKPEMFETRKDFALEVLKEPKWMQAFIFAGDKVEEFIKKTTAAKWVELMKEGGMLNE